MSRGRDHPTTSDGWDGILAEGERILWQGRPRFSLVPDKGQVLLALFGLAFAGFAAIWMALASMGPGNFWMFGLLHFTIGVMLFVFALFFAGWRRRHTWYTLTDRRAFIATDMPFRGRTLKSWKIDGETDIDYRPGKRAMLHFASDFRQTKSGTRAVPIGFERISDGDTVRDLMLGIRDRAQAAAAQTQEAS